MVREEINRMLDVLPESELNVVYSRIEMVYRKYMYEKMIADKGVQVTELCEESEEIVQRWDDVFAHNLDDVLKETIYYSQYKWHMFSYEQQDIYIFDKAFTWTYVHTHESMCGPYFYKVEQA